MKHRNLKDFKKRLAVEKLELISLQKKISKKRSIRWDPMKSVFATRIHENDGGSLKDSQEILDEAFEVDWEKCTTKLNVWSFITGEHPPGAFEVGDKVEVRSKDSEKWTSARVIKVRSREGSCDVKATP